MPKDAMVSEKTAIRVLIRQIDQKTKKKFVWKCHDVT